MDARRSLLPGAVKLVSKISAWGEITASHQKQEPSYFVIMSQNVSEQCLNTAKIIPATINL